jgi:hypothetical protein
MKNIRFVMLLIIFFVGESAAAAQAFQMSDVEFAPDLTELRGKTHVYVYSQDLSARTRIVKELLKYGRLSIAERIEDSDFIIAWGDNILTGGEPPAYGNAEGGAKVTIAKEMTVFRYVRLEDGSQRQRIIWHGRATKTIYSVPVPLRTAPSKGFSQGPRSAKEAGIELGIRLIFFWLSKSRPQVFAFDQVENQVIIFGRDPEVQAARAFVKALKQVDEANEVLGPPARLAGIFLRLAILPDLEYYPPPPLTSQPTMHTPRCLECAERPRRVKQ